MTDVPRKKLKERIGERRKTTLPGWGGRGRGRPLSTPARGTREANGAPLKGYILKHFCAAPPLFHKPLLEVTLVFKGTSVVLVTNYYVFYSFKEPG